MCPASGGGVGLGEAAGICSSGISVFGCVAGGVAEGDGEGVGDGETEGGLLAGIVWPWCCESTLWPSEKDKTRAADNNTCLHF